MRSDDTTERADFDSPPELSETYAQDNEENLRREGSLTDDLVALFEDGKTYAQAEMAFQKSRAGYTANQLKGAAVFGLGAFGVLHLALIALTVGLVIALTPLVGPWLATAIVTVALIVLGLIMLKMLKGKIDAIRSAFSGDGTND